MLRRKESWAKRDVLLDQDDFEDFQDLTPFRRMPLDYDGPAGDEGCPWQDPLRAGSMAAHAEGGLGSVALRKPLTPSELKRRQQRQSTSGAREARIAAKAAREAEKARFKAQLQLKSYLENLEWALPPETVPDLLEVFRPFVSACPGRTTLPRELAGRILRAAGVRNLKEYRRFYIEHGRGLWLPSQPAEYLDSFTRPENAEFFGVAEAELPLRRRAPVGVGSRPSLALGTAQVDAQPLPRRIRLAPVAPASSNRGGLTSPRRGEPQSRETQKPSIPANVVQSIMQRYREAQQDSSEVVDAEGPGRRKVSVVSDSAYRQARREFATIRAIAVKSRFAKVADFLVAFVDHRLPAAMPPRPDLMYPEFWRGWQHFLGETATVEPQDELREYLPQMTPDGFIEYEFAREYARQAGRGSAEDWAAFSARHPAVPANPQQVYADSGFTTWQAFLGQAD